MQQIRRFAVWANLQQHKALRTELRSISEYFDRYATLAKSSANNIDIGLTSLHELVVSIPESVKLSQASDIVAGLTNHYQARVIEPIIEDKEEPLDDRPRLTFPRVIDAFIPQAFKVFRQSVKSKRLEDDSTWEDLEARNDLGAFLLSYLSSPYSTQAPLLILGHPGSGKSLLTTILSAQLMSRHFTAIRVALREVDSEAGIISQIEEQIGRITNIRLDSWARVSSAFKNNPPVVILDGYDELLQASGKVFSGYLKDVQNFQKNEAEQTRSVRVIVTSRITLIDKATVPQGATVVRLLDFDKRRRDKWVSVWNKTNVSFFAATNTEPLVLPSENDPDSSKILSLAKQPLLLLMLALYDSDANSLRNSKTLDRTVLYDSLLRKFVSRERAKAKSFEELGKTEKKKELDFEMRRLGVAAMGMYNRRKLHTLSIELDDDLKFFEAERPITVSGGRALSQADLLLGSFFFVHKSKAQQKGGASEYHEEVSAFEFLHNTFGEFLTADFTLRQTLSEIETLIALKRHEALAGQLRQKLGDADGFSAAWLASLIYTPLFTRPVVLEMVREWIGHVLKSKQISRADFIEELDLMVMNQLSRALNKREMPSLLRKESLQEGSRAGFPEYPLLGHLAIYTLNLVLLRVASSEEPFIFDESRVGSHEDGARPWDRLVHTWRSWFAAENLSGVTVVMHAERDKSKVVISAKKALAATQGRTRLEILNRISDSLADNIPASLTGLVLYQPGVDDATALDTVEARLKAEQIESPPLLIKTRLVAAESDLANEDLRTFVNRAFQTLQVHLSAGRSHDLEDIVAITRRGIKSRLMRSPKGRRKERAVDSEIPPPVIFALAERDPAAASDLLAILREVGLWRWPVHFVEEFFHRILHPGRLFEVTRDDPDSVLALITLLRQMGGWRWAGRFGMEFFERTFRPPHLIELAERNPTAALSLLLVAREFGFGSWPARYGEELFESVFRRSSYLLNLADADPEAAIRLIQLVKELGGNQSLQQYGGEFFAHVLRPRFLIYVAGHNPQLAVAFIDIITELAGASWWDGERNEVMRELMDPRFLADLTRTSPVVSFALVKRFHKFRSSEFGIAHSDFADHFVDPRYLVEVAEGNPIAALSLLQIAWLVSGPNYLERHGDKVWSALFTPNALIPVLRGDPAVFVGALRLARAYRWDTRTRIAFTQSLVTAYDGPEGLSIMFSKLPLDALPDLEMLADDGPGEEVQSLLAALRRRPHERIGERVASGTLPIPSRRRRNERSDRPKDSEA